MVEVIVGLAALTLAGTGTALAFFRGARVKTTAPTPDKRGPNSVMRVQDSYSFQLNRPALSPLHGRTVVHSDTDTDGNPVLETDNSFVTLHDCSRISVRAKGETM